MIFRHATHHQEDGSEATSETKVVLLSVFPVTPALQLTIAQVKGRPITLDLRDGQYIPPVKPSMTLQPLSVHYLIHLTEMALQLQLQDEKITLSVNSNDTLKVFMNECKRLQAPANDGKPPELSLYRYYLSQCPTSNARMLHLHCFQ